MTRIVLASASPARLKVLRSAGLQPEVIPSNVDEQGIDAQTPRELALALSKAKASAVAHRLHAGLVIGCDSVLEVTSTPSLAGIALGKPTSAEEAKSLWRQISGQTGTLFTGHCIIDAASRGTVSEVVGTEIFFGYPSELEIEAYVATGEPSQAAGSFSLDGHGAWFIEEIRGEYSNVLGISLPLLRKLLISFDIAVTDLWEKLP